MDIGQYSDGNDSDELTYDRNEGEDANEDCDGEENENEGIQFVVTFLNYWLSLKSHLVRFW